MSDSSSVFCFLLETQPCVSPCFHDYPTQDSSPRPVQLHQNLLSGTPTSIHWGHSDLQSNIFLKCFHSLPSDLLCATQTEVPSLTLFKALARAAGRVILKEEDLLGQGRGPFFTIVSHSLPPEGCDGNCRTQLHRALTIPGLPIHHPSQQPASGSAGCL